MASENMEAVAAFLKKLRFRKRVLGGVDEEDVWRQLEKLQSEYEAAYDAQRIRFEALLKERDDQIVGLKEAVKQLRIIDSERSGP